MVLGRPEEHVLAQYKEAIDDSAREILRTITAEYADKIHDLASRLETNLAEKRHRERKRATAANEDDMSDVEENTAEWQVAQRRRGRRTPSATGEPRVSGADCQHSPRRAAGTPATPPGAGVGSLTTSVAAGLQAAAEQATLPNRGGGGWLRPHVITYKGRRSRESHPPKMTDVIQSLTRMPL